MTTGNDATPTPDNKDQQQPGDVQPQAALAPADQGETPASTLAADPDDTELLAAKTAAQAEEAGGDGKDQSGAAQSGAQPGAQQPPPQQPQPKGQQADPGDKPEPIMVPKARLDEALGKARDAELEAARYRGIAEARSTPPASNGAGVQQQPQPQQPTLQDRFNALRSEQDALAKQFDDGEITMSEFKTKERALNDQELNLREENLLQRVKPAPAKPDQLYLETLTAQLEEQHPWTRALSEFADKTGSNAEWDYLKNRAIENLTQRGIDPRAGDMGRYELRKEIAVLADQLGPALIGNKAGDLGIVLPGQGQQGAGQQRQQPNGQQQPSPQQRKAALDKAANAPPNLNNMGGTTTGADGTPTDARIETMSDDDIGNLPEPVRRKLLGIT